MCCFSSVYLFFLPSFLMHSTAFSPNLQLNYVYQLEHSISIRPAFLLTLMSLLLNHTLWCCCHPHLPASCHYPVHSTNNDCQLKSTHLFSCLLTQIFNPKKRNHMDMHLGKSIHFRLLLVWRIIYWHTLGPLVATEHYLNITAYYL